MPMHGAGWKSGNKQVSKGKVTDVPEDVVQKPVDEPELEDEGSDQEEADESQEGAAERRDTVA